MSRWRSYISYHLYDQADKLVSKTAFPTSASNAQFAVHKYFITVELLMGDISDRSLFRHVVLEKALIAYFDIDKGKIYLPLSLLTTFNLVLPKFSSVRFSPHFLRTENRTDRIFSELNRTGIELNRTGIELVRTGSTCSVRFQNRFEQANRMILYVLI